MQLLIPYAMQFVGKPYIWGDKTPVKGGYDCSGFVCEILRFAGLVGNKEVLNAQMLYNRVVAGMSRPNMRSAGALAFYGPNVGQINHVAFMVDQYRILEAGGGDSTTTTPEIADARGAMVRGRLVGYRADLLLTIKPDYSKIGLVV